MNCYYSNLIEGHNTHPRDIDRALRKDLSSQPKKRELQLEAVAHIEVQKAIDLGKDDHSHPLSSRFAMWLLFNFLSAVPAPRWQRQVGLPQERARSTSEPRKKGCSVISWASWDRAWRSGAGRADRWLMVSPLLF